MAKIWVSMWNNKIGKIIVHLGRQKVPQIYELVNKDGQLYVSDKIFEIQWAIEKLKVTTPSSG